MSMEVGSVSFDGLEDWDDLYGKDSSSSAGEKSFAKEIFSQDLFGHPQCKCKGFVSVD